jgi:hypothetical protein
MFIPSELLPALLLSTIIIEFALLWILVRRSPAKLLLYSALVNCVTWPVATLVYRGVFVQFFFIEILVFAAEAVMLKLLLRIKLKNAALLSLAANSITAAIGLLVALL